MGWELRKSFEAVNYGMEHAPFTPIRELQSLFNIIPATDSVNSKEENEKWRCLQATEVDQEDANEPISPQVGCMGFSNNFSEPNAAKPSRRSRENGFRWLVKKVVSGLTSKKGFAYHCKLRGSHWERWRKKMNTERVTALLHSMEPSLEEDEGRRRRSMRFLKPTTL